MNDHEDLKRVKSHKSGRKDDTKTREPHEEKDPSLPVESHAGKAEKAQYSGPANYEYSKKAPLDQS